LVAVPPVQGPSTTTLVLPVTPVAPVSKVTPALPQSEGLKKVGADPGGVKAATHNAAVRQAALGPLIADLGQASDGAALPAPVQTAAGRVLAQAIPLEGATGGDLARMFARSGLFMEARLAAAPQASPVARDFKADLLILRQALQSWLAGAPRTPGRTPGATPPPPFRGGPTSAQRAARPSLPREVAADQLAQRLLDETEGALARHELLQLASLPDLREGAAASRWLFEAPFMTPQGATVAQFEISRDAPPAGAGAAAPTWRVRFSIDLEPLGPLHAHVSLAGDHAQVAVWAERPQAAERLRARSTGLTQALMAAQLRSEVLVHVGQPQAAATSAGHFMDRAT
jgi:hypothetical protein